MKEAVHVEVPGHTMLHLAPTVPQARLIVKRWVDGQWRVVAQYKGTYGEMEHRLVQAMGQLEDELDARAARAARHVDQWEG